MKATPLDEGRDTFICGLLMHEQPGLISLQRSQEPGSERSQADGKMFLFSLLKLFIKGSLLPRIARARAVAPRRCDGDATPCDSRKRDCGLLTTTSPAFSYISYLCFALPRHRLRRPSGLTAREILLRGRMAARWGGKWEKLRQLPADFGI